MEGNTPTRVPVYRVEHAQTKVGPYNGGHSCSWPLRKMHALSDNHPAWMWDDIPAHSDHVAGFDSLEKLFAWFSGCMDMLVENGYHIRIFYVDPARILHGRSGLQIAFPL